MIKRAVSLLISLVLLFSMGITAFGESGILSDMPRVDNRQRVHDLGGLYTKEQKEELEQQAQKISNEYNMDMVIATTKDALGRDGENYSFDFYEANNFGVGKNGDGVIFLIDMDNRRIELSAKGRAKRLFTDNNTNYILDAAITPMLAQDPDFYATSKIVLERSANIFSEWPSYRNGIIAASFGGGLAVSAIILIIMYFTAHKSSMSKEISAISYIPGGNINMIKSDDRFVNTFTSRTPRPKPSNTGGGSGGGGSSGGSISFGGGSSSRSSSSGGSFSGGGRSF